MNHTFHITLYVTLVKRRIGDDEYQNKTNMNIQFCSIKKIQYDIFFFSKYHHHQQHLHRQITSQKQID